MTKPTHTPLRNFRLDDATWQAAKEKAAAEGTTVSAVLAAYLTRWVKTPPRRRP